jgi:hypothetical protein
MNLLDLVTNIPHLLKPSKKEKFMRIFSEYLNKYAQERKTRQRIVSFMLWGKFG